MKGFGKTAGFSLIELVAAIFVITVGLGSLFAVVHRGRNHMRIVASKNCALIAAASELELIKAMPKESVPKEYIGPFLGEVDLSALTNGDGTVRIRDHAESGGRLKVVTATVKWTVAGRDKSVSLSTLIGRP